jgi:hypothetical protein
MPQGMRHKTRDCCSMRYSFGAECCRLRVKVWLESHPREQLPEEVTCDITYLDG